jgi:cysteine/histidine-rich domain-containing protein 1
MPRPDQTQIELNAGRLKVDTRFGTDTKTKRFSNEWELFGLVDINQSTIELLQSKIEIILKKAEPLSWSRLDRP